MLFWAGGDSAVVGREVLSSPFSLMMAILQSSSLDVALLLFNNARRAFSTLRGSASSFLSSSFLSFILAASILSASSLLSSSLLSSVVDESESDEEVAEIELDKCSPIRGHRARC